MSNNDEKIISVGEFGGTIPLPSVEDMAEARKGLVLEDKDIKQEYEEDDDTEENNNDEEESTNDESTENQDEDLEAQDEENDSESNNLAPIDLGIELPKKGAKYTIKLKDGREFTLPGDVMITSKVDGEVKDYVLHDQMKVAGGEEAIEKRLARVKEHENQVVEIKSQLSQYEQNLVESQKALVNTIQEDPVKGLKSVVEALEVPPGEFLRKMIIGVHELEKEIYANYIQKILPPGTDTNSPQGQALIVEGYRQYLKGLDTEHYQNRLKKQEEAQLTGKRTAEQARAAALQAVEDRGITKEYADRAAELLRREDSWRTKKDEEKISAIIEHGKVLWVLDQIGSVEGIPDNYMQNKEFLIEVNSVVDPRIHSPEKAKRLINSIAKDYFNNSKKGVDNKQRNAVISKQVLSGISNSGVSARPSSNGHNKGNKPVVVKSASDIDALFR